MPLEKCMERLVAADLPWQIQLMRPTFQSRRARLPEAARAPTVRKSWTLRMAPVSAGGEMVQPTRQPVTL